MWVFRMGRNKLENEVYWEYSFSDLRELVDLTAQHELAKANQEYENLVLIAKAVFGNSGSDVVVIQNADDILQFNSWG